MRIISKIFASFAIASTLCGAVSAYSPFDAVLGYLPDLAVTDIHQEGRFVYERVCNLGGTLADSEDTVVLAMRKSGGGVVSIVAPIVLEADNCHEFQVASVDELGITTSGMYEISGGAVLKDGRIEKVKTNNKFIKTVSIIYPSTNAPALQNPVYYNNNYNNNYRTNYYDTDGRYCDYSNNYCSNTYYCNSVNQNCYRDTYRGGSSTYYCPAGNNLCLNNTYNGSYNYYRSNICPTWDTACNNSYYNSINTQYRDNTHCTYSNNYCQNNSNCTYSNNYCNNSDYNRRDRHDNTLQNRKPDFTVSSITANDNGRALTARICNNGDDMFYSNSWTVEIANTTTSSLVRNSGTVLGRGQCTDVNVSYSSLGVYRSGGYNFRVIVDPDNAVAEESE